MQPIINSSKGREFAASAVAVQAIVVNDNEEILLLKSQKRNHGWQIISGGLDANETVLHGVLREVDEEIGSAVRARPLGVVHVQSFHYDDNVQHMIGVYYLLAYEGGTVIPGDDMIGSAYRWWSLNQIAAEKPDLHVSTIFWMLERAIELYRLWKDAPQRPLQPTL